MIWRSSGTYGFFLIDRRLHPLPGRVNPGGVRLGGKRPNAGLDQAIGKDAAVDDISRG
jgi:hypothetical protein